MHLSSVHVLAASADNIPYYISRCHLRSLSFTYVATRMVYDSSVDSEMSRKEWISLTLSVLTLRVSCIYGRCVSERERENSGIHSCTLRSARGRATHPTTIRLSTSADEVQGLLGRDFSSSTVEYVVIGFCGDTPRNQPLPSPTGFNIS